MIAINIEKLIFKLFEDVKRYQNNIDETLAITLSLIYLIHDKEKNFVANVKPEEPELKSSYDKSFDYLFDTFYNHLFLNFANEHLFEYLIKNIEEYAYIANFSKNSIKNIIEKLFDEKYQFLSSSARPTDKFTQKLITKIAQKLAKFEVPLPPLEEQAEIVRRVKLAFEKLDKIESGYRKAKEYSDKHTQSILNKAFRGELVPQNPNDKPIKIEV